MRSTVEGYALQDGLKETSLDHALDPRTPVIVGAGEYSERTEDADYQALSPVDLAAAAARAAIANADGRTIEQAVDTVVGIRQMDISAPFGPPLLGRSDNFPRSVADRVGLRPRRAILAVTGGQSPQQMVNEVAATIAAGDCDVALLFGAEATSTTRHFEKAERRPDFGEERGGQLDDRGYGLERLPLDQLLAHALNGAPSQFALFENARRARLGLDRRSYTKRMGELFAPFTRVAAANAHAVLRSEYSASELVTVTERNRMVAEPYRKLLVARDLVNQAAALLVMSVGAARRLGVAEEKWVFLHGHCNLDDVPLLDRRDLSIPAAACAAVDHTLQLAGLTPAEISYFDLYSCFPVSVSAMTDHLELAENDPRGLTVTGGLPFFGGPGNNYATHAIGAMCTKLRAEPGASGLIVTHGGPFNKSAAGLYSTRPQRWRGGESASIQRRLDKTPAVPSVFAANGWLEIETYTVKYGRDGLVGIVAGRLASTGERALATATGDDELALLVEADPLGASVFLRSSDFGNTMTLSQR